MKRKICVITGTRADYGLLYWVIKGLSENEDVELQLVATGMHLSPEFGLTYKQIQEDGFKITRNVEILLSSDTPIGIGKSMGLAMIGFSEVFESLGPEVIVVLGDRFEIFCAVASAMVARIPVAHCCGGEATYGAIDEAFRHSITKMSHIHFTSTDEYRRRVIQLGESPMRVFNVGALGIENINKLKLLSRKEFERCIDFKLGERNILITFHPVTLENQTAEVQFRELLEALNGFEEVKIIFTKSNSDTEGRVINFMIDDYVSKHPNKAIAFTSLGQVKYLSALKYVDMVVGNSSSGVIEVPSFKKATINIGDRQLGRIRASSVIDCEPIQGEIRKAIEYAYSESFRVKLAEIVNPYGVMNSSEKIIPILKTLNLHNLIKKEFYNIEVS